MRPGLLLAIVFIGLTLVAAALSGVAGWTLIRAGLDGSEEQLLLFDAAALVGFLFALAGAWAVLYLRLVRPIDALTREVETLSHAPTARRIELPEGHATGGLADALHTLIGKFIAARDETDKAVEIAIEQAEAYRRRLETILLDMSEGVVVCNLDNRILLYNQAAMRILARPEALGLGRRLFGLFDRATILPAVDDLMEKQRADTTKKLQVSRRVGCERLDGADAIEARLALICSDEVEAEGYVLTFTSAEETGAGAEAPPPRPEFYDFDLFKRQPDRAVTEIPLSELRCVVFDTETTGLEPSKGDEIISIGAIRVVNGRLVRGETFEQLVDPGKKIPKASIRFHGITDADVKGKPGVADALPRFHAFVGRSVLVAHNAAFDMKFLELKEKAAGVAFKTPVLDVLLLSAFLHDHTKEHSLDATASRFGVDIAARHSALGDAMVTAAVFLAMLDPLYERGVHTLGDALDVSAKMVEIRKQQANF